MSYDSWWSRTLGQCRTSHSARVGGAHLAMVVVLQLSHPASGPRYVRAARGIGECDIDLPFSTIHPQLNHYLTAPKQHRA